MKRMISISEELLLVSERKLILGTIIANVKVDKFNLDLWKLIETSCCTLKSNYQTNDIINIEQINSLKNTYKNLGLKLSDYKGSNEALVKRVINDKNLYQINNIVDINNLISIESLRSVGSYDVDKLSGEIIFRKGEISESYIGTTKKSIQLCNLPVLTDTFGPFGSPTSDSNRALISESTTKIMMIIYSFDGCKELDEQIARAYSLLERFAYAKHINHYKVSDKSLEIKL